MEKVYRSNYVYLILSMWAIDAGMEINHPRPNLYLSGSKIHKQYKTPISL